MLLLAIGGIALSACGGGGGGTEPEIDPATGNRIIKILFHVNQTTAEGKAYKKRIDAFNEAHKEEKIKASATFKARTTGGADYEKQLIAYQLDGSLPDIITFDAPNCASYAAAGILYDISSQFNTDERDDFLSLNIYNNKIYGVPIQESSAGFFYNKRIFADAGIDVSGYTVDNPWTFDDFRSVCQRLKGRCDWPVDMRLYDTGDETAPYLLYSFIHAAGGEFVSSDGYTAKGYFDSDASKKGFKFIKGLVSDGYTSYAIGKGDFFDQKIGMYLSSGWTISDLDNKYQASFPNRDSWGLLPYPKDVKAASATGSWSYAVTDNGVSNKDAVYKLLKWMTSAESSTEVTNATGMIPCRKSCNPNYADGSPENILYKQLEQTGKERPVTVGYPQFSSAFNSVIYKLKDNDVDGVVNDEAASLQKELDRVKEQYNH